MDKEKLKNILTKIGQINPQYNLEKQVYNVGKLIQFIQNPSEKVQLAAVKKNPWAIEYIQNPSQEVQLAAVEKNSLSIRFIKNPSEKVQLNAVRKNPNSIQYIKNPTQKVKKTDLHVLSGGLFGP
jgi:hypothetical protein